MKRRADGSFLPENAQGTCRKDAGLPLFSARRIHEEKTDFVCLRNRKNKSLEHTYPVTTVTYSNNSGLVVFSYSASSVSEFAAGSSSGRFRLIPARVSTELTFLEEA